MKNEQYRTGTNRYIKLIEYYSEKKELGKAQRVFEKARENEGIIKTQLYAGVSKIYAKMNQGEVVRSIHAYLQHEKFQFPEEYFQKILTQFLLVKNKKEVLFWLEQMDKHLVPLTDDILSKCQSLNALPSRDVPDTWTNNEEIDLKKFKNLYFIMENQKKHAPVPHGAASNQAFEMQLVALLDSKQIVSAFSLLESTSQDNRYYADNCLFLLNYLNNAKFAIKQQIKTEILNKFCLDLLRNFRTKIPEEISLPFLILYLQIGDFHHFWEMYNFLKEKSGNFINSEKKEDFLTIEIEFYLKKNDLKKVCEILFDKKYEFSSVVCFNKVLGYLEYFNSNKLKLANEIFQMMMERKIKPNHQTWKTLIFIEHRAGVLNEEKFLEKMKKHSSLSPNLLIFQSFLKIYMNSSNFESGKRIIEIIESQFAYTPDSLLLFLKFYSDPANLLVSHERNEKFDYFWNILGASSFSLTEELYKVYFFHYLTNLKDLNNAEKLLLEMNSEFYSTSVFNLFFSFFARNNLLQNGIDWHQKMIFYQVPLDNSTFNSLLALFLQNDRFDRATRLIDDFSNSGSLSRLGKSSIKIYSHIRSLLVQKNFSHPALPLSK